MYNARHNIRLTEASSCDVLQRDEEEWLCLVHEPSYCNVTWPIKHLHSTEQGRLCFDVCFFKGVALFSVTSISQKAFVLLKGFSLMLIFSLCASFSIYCYSYIQDITSFNNIIMYRTPSYLQHTLSSIRRAAYPSTPGPILCTPTQPRSSSKSRKVLSSSTRPSRQAPLLAPPSTTNRRASTRVGR